MRDIPSLTGLRGVAALWVLGFHVCKIAGASGAVWASHGGVLTFGWTGVDLFFVLSGFILMWVHGAEFRQPTGAALGRFTISRVLRVYPLSFVVLALIAVLAAVDPAFVAWSRAQDPANFSAGALIRTALLATRWTNAPGDWNEPTWSLSAEIVGYLAFPFLASVLMRGRVAPAVAIAAASLATLAAFELMTGLVGSNPIDQIPALMRMGCGFIAGMAGCRVRLLLGPHGMRSSGAGALLACLGLGVALQFKAGSLLAPTAFVLLIFCLSFGQDGALNRTLSSRPALFLGRISFPLYLLHLTPLLWLTSHIRLANLDPVETAVLLFGYVAFCLGLASFLHHAVERPLHVWAKRGFIASPSARPAALPA